MGAGTSSSNNSSKAITILDTMYDALYHNNNNMVPISAPIKLRKGAVV